MNEPYRPQQPYYPPPAPPSPWQPPGQQAEQVVRVWVRKGWFGPMSLAATFWVIAAIVELWSIQAEIPHFFMTFEIILFASGVLAIVCAFRRKATLTTRQLILRQLFSTQRLLLHEIVTVRRYSHRSGDDDLTTAILGFIWYAVAPILVEMQTKNDHGYHNYCTGAFGWKANEAMVMIAKAAKAAGSPIDI